MNKELIDRCKPQYRDLFAFVIKNNSEARKLFKHLIRMKAKNIRPDYMLARMNDGGYERFIDVGVWACEIIYDIHVVMIRHSDGKWLLHS